MINISCALVGLGNIGFEYKKNFKNTIQNHAKALSSIKKINFVGGIDKSLKKRKDFSKKYNIQSFRNLTELKKKNKPNFFVVCVNTKNIYNVIREIILNFTPKIIVCEKPISFHYKEVLKIIYLCKKKKIKLYINFQRRSDPSYISLKKKINKVPNKMEGNIFYDKGFIYNCCHYINLILYLFGNYKSHYNFKIKKMNKFDYMVNTKIIFNNATVNFIYKNKTIKEFEFKNERNMLLKYKNKPICYNSKKYDNSFKMSQKHFYLELIKSLNKKSSNICDANEALKTFKLIFLILKGYKK